MVKFPLPVADTGGMAFGLGIILATVGAILAWAVTVEAEGVDLYVIGIILLVAGIVTILVSLLLWSTWAGPGYFARSRRTVLERDAAGRREIVDEEIR